MEVIEFTEKQQVFINSHNTHNIGIVGNRFGDIKSPLVSNDKEVIRQIIREEERLDIKKTSTKFNF